MEDIEKVLGEFQGLDSEEALKLLIEKLARMEKEQQILQSKLSRLEHVFHQSELIVSIPAFDIVTQSKLPNLIIEASDSVAFDQNLYEIEEYNDSTYRFMGPEKITNFTLPIERSVAKDVTIKLLSEAQNGIFQGLKFYVDGNSIDPEWEPGNSSATFRFTLAPTDSQHDTLLTIYSSTVVRPADTAPGSEDFRYISASLLSIEVL
jgi:hypothetical protein